MACNNKIEENENRNSLNDEVLTVDDDDYFLSITSITCVYDDRIIFIILVLTAFSCGYKFMAYHQFPLGASLLTTA